MTLTKIISLLGLIFFFGCNSHQETASTKTSKNSNKSKPEDPKKLKIVFLMGQSNMVGFAKPNTAWYLTQKPYAPPIELAEKNKRFYDGGSFYWGGVSTALGSPEFMQRGKDLLAERKKSRSYWRGHIFGNFSRAAIKSGKKDEWNYKEWGDPPGKGEHAKTSRQQWLDIQAEKEGIYKRMEEYIESPENKFHPKVAIQKIPEREKVIAEDVKRVRDIFLKGTTGEDFDKLEAAKAELLVKVNAERAKQKLKAVRTPFKNLLEHAKFYEEHVNLPVAKRTYITAMGEVRGETEEILAAGNYMRKSGLLTFGYGKFEDSSGPEYAFGISFEQMVDGPVLLVKCAVGGTALTDAWLSPSNAEEGQQTGGLWRKAQHHIQTVLADPGQFHPDYDPAVGYDLAGLIWFQGWNDMGNERYGEMLVNFIKDFRKEVKAPDLPVISGLLGQSGWEQRTFSNHPNRGMLYAAQQPEFKDNMDVVNSLPFFPIELNVMPRDHKDRARSIGPGGGLHYHGNAKFMYLLGDAFALSLKNIRDGGQPTFLAEAEAIKAKFQ